MWEIKDYIESKKPSTPLLVTVTGDRTAIVPYEPLDRVSLQEQMQAEKGSRKFIFDPQSNDDMKYMLQLYRFDKYVAYASCVREGINKLTAAEALKQKHENEAANADQREEQPQEGKSGKKKKNKAKKTPKITLTSAEMFGMGFYRGLFKDAITAGRINEALLEEMGKIQRIAFEEADYQGVPDPALLAP